MGDRVDGSGACGDSQEAFNILRKRYEGSSEVRVCRVLAEMQTFTLQPGEDSDVYLVMIYRLGLLLHQADCMVDDYQLKVNSFSGQSAEYTPVLKQLRIVNDL